MNCNKQLRILNENHEDYFRAEELFCNIYFKTIYRVLDMRDSNNVNHLRRYLNLIRSEANAFCEFFKNPDGINDDCMLNLLADSLFYRITYVYRNSLLLSSAVWYHFRNMAEDNPTILQTLLRKKVVKICSLGCGPASDLVAVVQVLESEAKLRGLDLDIRITAVDIDRNWKNTCFSVLSNLDRFQNSSEKVKFIQADLSQFHTMDVLTAVNVADIITLVKFSSEFVSQYMKFTDTIQEISEVMKRDAILFLLDRNSTEIIKKSDIMGEKMYDFKLIYEEVCDLHTLETATVEMNYHLYNSYFGANVSNTCFKVFVRAWLKADSTEFRNQLIFENRLLHKREKYNALQFFRTDSFKEWEDSLATNMLSAGWNKAGVEHYIENLKELMDDLFLSLRRAEESVNLVRLKLSERNKQTIEIEASDRKTYIYHKRNLAFIKRQIYCEEIILLRGYLKAKFDGIWRV